MDDERCRNYVRLSVLLLDFSKDMLLKVLREKVSFKALQMQVTENKRRLSKEVNFSQRHILYPKGGFNIGVYDKLDLSLICLLLNKSMKSGSEDADMLKNIKTLLSEKDKLYGNPKCVFIDEETFTYSWNTSKKALIAIGTGYFSKEVIERKIDEIHDIHVQSTVTDAGYPQTMGSYREQRKLLTDAPFEWTEGTSMFVQISKLMCVCSILLRSLLIEKINLRDLAEKIRVQKHILSIVKPYQKSKFVELVKDAANKQNPADWYTDLDLSCLYLSLRYWGNIPKHAKDWGKPPEKNDFSLAADLDRLYGVRHNVLHYNRGTDIDVEDFRHYKQTLFSVIRRLVDLIHDRKQEETIEGKMGELLFSEYTELNESQQISSKGRFLVHSYSLTLPDTCTSMDENVGKGKQDDHSSFIAIDKRIVLENFKTQYSDKLTNAFLGHYCGKPGDVFIVAYLKQTVTKSKYWSKFEDVKVLNIDCRFVGPEAAEVMYSKKSTENKITFQDIEKMETLITENSDTLMKKHSNLEMISGSSVRSTGGHISVETCIVFYCRTKGVVPLGEENFPRTLGEYKIDVREGLFQWAPGNTASQSPNEFYNPLRMGCNIGLKGKSSKGSLGGFVDIKDDGVGFLTCAHVLYNNEKLEQDGSPGDSDYVVQPAGDSEDAVCGKVFKYVFDPTGPVGIDAALVQIMSREPDQGMFAGLDEENMRFAGFNFNDPLRYNNGSVRRLGEGDMDRRVIKSGATTKFTRGVFGFKGTSINVFDTLLNFNSRPLDQPLAFSMKGQIEIYGLSGVVFAQPGDSGSLVFIVDEDQSVSCIGMVEGWTTHYSTIVTPITDILNKLELDNTQLHQFSDLPQMELG